MTMNHTITALVFAVLPAPAFASACGDAPICTYVNQGSSSHDSEPSIRSNVQSLVAQAAARHGAPVKLALGATKIESGFNCSARGRAGELGPLQIKPATARGLGYSGPVSALRSCGAGLEWGMRHLSIAYHKCGHAGLHQKGLAGSCRRSAYSSKVAAAASRF